MIAYIQNAALRRSIIAITALPAFVLCVVLGAAAGALEHGADAIDAFGSAWRGRPPRRSA